MRLVAVCGSDVDDPSLSEYALREAEELGSLLALRGAILLCGGKGGVMEAVARGAKKNHGITVGILPFSKKEANPFIDVPLPTSLGPARNFLLINSADAVIGIGGRWGTLSELSFAMNLGKPTVVIKGTGGWANLLALIPIPEKEKPMIASSAREAIALLGI
jgi:hypothetical protein